MSGARRLAAALAGASAVLAAATAAFAQAPVVEVVSSAPSRVTGGDALIRLSAAGGVVRLNGVDVSGAFKPDPRRPGTSLGLVSGLGVGRNRLEVVGPRGRALGALTLTNYPITGPVISGPHVQPFVCQTHTFLLPDGTTLGPATDANCSAPAKVTYVYLPKDGTVFQPLKDPTVLPADVAMTTTTSGAVAPFVVRVETRVINRGIHQNAVLFDPTAEAQPTPWSPPKAWNRRLLALHGAGCPGGWYIQGGVQGEKILDLARLAEGYAIFINTLRHPTNSCNPVLAGETTMMDKEYFIERFGSPEFTVSRGSSGGAYTSLQVADAHPGLFDGVLIGSTFPDALSIALAGLDDHLLTHFLASHPEFSEQQAVAISGYKGLQALIDAANQAQRTDPVSGRADIKDYKAAVWNPAVPAELRYDPATNPHGARPTVFDAARNVYGVDPETGKALRPFDNVGVQYGLSALRSGAITTEQFILLNEQIGGYDQDANYVPARSVGDAGAIRRAQQTGAALGGGGGLASIPVFNAGAGGFLYDEDFFYHYQWFHFAVRERMRQANGDISNHVMWRGGLPISYVMRAYNGGAALTGADALYTNTVVTRGWSAFIEWVAAAKADTGPGSQRAKTLRNKPATLLDGCWAKEAEPRFIAEPQTLSARPDSACNTLYPSFSFTRREAGGPVAANIYKCALKPVDPADYPPATTPAQLQRLRAVFPAGVCDFTRPGIAQAGVIPQPRAPQ